MPLYITRASSLIKEPSHIWRIGKRIPRDNRLGDSFDECKFTDVASVKATDEELEYVVSRFSNIPHTMTVFGIDSKSLTWRGETAQFIYEHLQDGL